MKPIDLLLVAALVLLCSFLSLTLAVPVGLLVGAVCCCGLWYLLGEDDA